MKIEEFEAEKQWWGNEDDGFKGRKEGEYSWRVTLEDLKARNYNLDIKNPHVGNRQVYDPDHLLAQFVSLQSDIASIRNRLKMTLAEALERGRS